MLKYGLTHCQRWLMTTKMTMAGCKLETRIGKLRITRGPSAHTHLQVSFACPGLLCLAMILILSLPGMANASSRIIRSTWTLFLGLNPSVTPFANLSARTFTDCSIMQLANPMRTALLGNFVDINLFGAAPLLLMSVHVGMTVTLVFCAGLLSP